MISKDITAVQRVAGAQFHKCILELLSTNKENQWLLQLLHEEEGPHAFLFGLGDFQAFCTGLRVCIDAARSPSEHPEATTMLQIVAAGIPTTIAEEGSITIISVWDDDPNVQLNFYTDRSRRGSCITLIYFLEDAMALYDMFATAYNNRNRSNGLADDA